MPLSSHFTLVQAMFHNSPISNSKSRISHFAPEFRNSDSIHSGPIGETAPENDKCFTRLPGLPRHLDSDPST